jgi:hypothetical protein
MFRQFGLLALSLAVLIVTPAVHAAVLITPAPEIDPASAMSGLSLLAGGILVLRGRRPGK